MTGLKYHRITGATDDKAPYQPGVALERAAVHAGNFLQTPQQVTARRGNAAGAAHRGGPYDAELFGHWWFEGPVFSRILSPAPQGESLGRKRARSGHVARLPRPSSGDDARHACASSWGAGGYGEVWVGPESSEVWRHVHHAGRYVAWILDRHRSADGARGARSIR